MYRKSRARNILTHAETQAAQTPYAASRWIPSVLARSTMPYNVAIIGPSRNKQGTGPYVAKIFHLLGAHLSAVVSSSKQSAAHAAECLSKEYGDNCKGFADMEKMLECVPVDIVAICSPATAHLHYLNQSAEAGCHIFCEKPLWWPEKEVRSDTDVRLVMAETIRLVQLCNRKNIVLQLNTQWPFTLPGYYELCPQQNQPVREAKNFAMWLSPMRTGKEMIVDSTPHLLSMLYALFGGGRIHGIHSSYVGHNATRELHIQFHYQHAEGDCKTALFLNPATEVPRPAAYAMNDRRVDRHVDLPDYLISLRVPGKQLQIMDPLFCSVKNFLGSIHSESTLDETALIDGMEHLLQIYQAVDD